MPHPETQIQGRWDRQGCPQLWQSGTSALSNYEQDRAQRPQTAPLTGGAGSHFALVGFLEPLAKPDQAALLQRGQVTQVSLDVVRI